MDKYGSYIILRGILYQSSGKIFADFFTVNYGELCSRKFLSKADLKGLVIGEDKSDGQNHLGAQKSNPGLCELLK